MKRRPEFPSPYSPASDRTWKSAVVAIPRGERQSGGKVVVKERDPPSRESLSHSVCLCFTSARNGMVCGLCNMSMPVTSRSASRD